ncbi:NACHT nucleoside triphosphatase [Metarhizium guizhouense ARSEF 977]|uniref:NACHT nucleoside triphosphatase n=1 Tax=Metarhizium guizhouense (strain ARSEF 977) TaxID=1276136 RepID=A0A0B4HWC2_METGA|nr:NACHT nucleoside triphosphatase [Metarhizium guizhouense ARSEF 977]
MDPLTALGVASNVIAFVDFAWTLIKDAREISTSGASESITSIKSLFQNASTVNNKLASLPPAPPELQLMITESKKMAAEIMDALKTLTAPQDYDLEELLSIYNAVISQSTGIRFCFFIDGLDEFQETRRDPADLIKTLHALDCSPDIKLCVSSRPWTVFDDEFGGDCIWTPKLEDLTRDDIYRYVNDKFHAHPQFCKLITRDANYSKLVDQVTERAQGVFLWVYLVIRTLLQGLTYHDSLSTMQRRLETFPPELEAFFHHLIESVDTIYRRQTARYFSVALLAEGPASAMLFSFLDDVECNEAECLEQPISAMEYPEIEDRRDQLRRRLDGATKGLLELTDSPSAPDSYVRFQVDFLHRTVRDFLYDSVLMDVSFRQSLGGENAALTALHAALAEMKASPDHVKLLPRQFILFLKDALAEAKAEGSFIEFLDVEGPRLARKSVFAALDFTLYIRSRLYTPSGRTSRSRRDRQPDVLLLRVVKSVDHVLLETARLLLCQGCDVNRIMRSGALRYSIWSHFLMEYVGWANGQEPETIAIQLGSLCQLLRILLSHGAGPEATVYLVEKGTFPASQVLVLMLGPDAADQLLSETEASDSEWRGSPMRRGKGAESLASKEGRWPNVSLRYFAEPASPKAGRLATVQLSKRADTSAAGSRFLHRQNDPEPWSKVPRYSVQRPTPNEASPRDKGRPEGL